MTSPLNPHAVAFNPNAQPFAPALNISAPAFVPSPSAQPFLPQVSGGVDGVVKVTLGASSQLQSPVTGSTVQTVPIRAGFRRPSFDPGTYVGVSMQNPPRERGGGIPCSTPVGESGPQRYDGLTRQGLRPPGSHIDSLTPAATAAPHSQSPSQPRTSGSQVSENLPVPRGMAAAAAAAAAAGARPPMKQPLLASQMKVGVTPQTGVNGSANAAVPFSINDNSSPQPQAPPPHVPEKLSAGHRTSASPPLNAPALSNSSNANSAAPFSGAEGPSSYIPAPRRDSGHNRINAVPSMMPRHLHLHHHHNLQQHIKRVPVASQHEHTSIRPPQHQHQLQHHSRSSPPPQIPANQQSQQQPQYQDAGHRSTENTLSAPDLNEEPDLMASLFEWVPPYYRLGEVIRYIVQRRAGQRARMAPPTLPTRPPAELREHAVLRASPYTPQSVKSSAAAMPPRIGSAPLAMGGIGALTQRSGGQPVALYPPRDLPTRSNPLIVLIFGNRGSGKTTQAKVLAERYNLLHLSSGSIYKDGKKPMEELRRLVIQHFGAKGTRQYNGLVLDRFILMNEVDAYYVQSALNEANLPVPMVFWLRVDPKVGMDRANSRGDGKTAIEHWRVVEQRAQAAVADLVYQPIGCLYTVDAEALSEVEVSNFITAKIDAVFPKRSKNISLPMYSPIPGDDIVKLIDKYEVFLQVAKEAHVCVGNITGRTDSAPLSSIAGYVDSSYFQFGNKPKRSLIVSMRVTLKVDGTRFLLVKHKTYGYIGMPFIFNCCYDFNQFFEGTTFPDRSTAANADWKPASTRHAPNPSMQIDFLLDVELAVHDQSKSPLVYVIDFVYFYGVQGKHTIFSDRYATLASWFTEAQKGSVKPLPGQRVLLKEYVPVRDLGKLLPRIEDAPFEIDGIVFQHNDVYRFGSDKKLLKWKPQALCTADFRIMNCTRKADSTWECSLHVCDSSSAAATSVNEVPFPNATGVFTDEEMALHKLRDSMIVELGLKALRKNPIRTIWQFHRLRTDKPHPNKIEVVREIVELDHLSYPQLVNMCAKAS